MGLFIIENSDLKTGDTLLISGPTTGTETLVILEMQVNGTAAATASIGDKVTIVLPFRVRLSDKIFKILESSNTAFCKISTKLLINLIKWK